MLFPLIMFSYASRILSVDGIGKIDFVRNVVSFFIIIATLGVYTYGIREGAKVRLEREALSKLVKELLIVNLITTVVAYLLFFFCMFYIEKLNEYRDLLYIYGLCIGFTALGLEWLYNALEKFEYITIRYFIFQIISLVLLFVFVKDRSDYLIYISILTFSTVGSYLLNFIHSRKYVNYSLQGPINLKKHLCPILILFSNSLIGNIYLSLDSVMLGWLTSPYNVGIYAAANKINRLGLTVITTLFVVILPRASYYINNNEFDKFKVLIEKSVHFVFMMAIPMVGLVFLLSRDFIIVLSGPDFVPATLCSQILSFIIILVPLSSMASNEIIIPSGFEKKLLYSSVAGTSVNAFLNFILIPYYHESGAAIASIFAELSVTLLTSYFAFKCFDFLYALKKIWQYVFATAIMVILLQYLNFAGDAMIKCIVFAIIGITIYFATLLLLKNWLLIELYGDFRNILTKLYNR